MTVPLRFAAVASLVFVLAACGGGDGGDSSASPTTSSSSPTSSAPSPTPEPSSSTAEPSPTITPLDTLFVDVVETDLATYSEVVGTPFPGSDLQIGIDATVTGAGVSFEQWQGTVTREELVGLDFSISAEDLEALGMGLSDPWRYNSISTSSTTATLVATQSDGLRLEIAAAIEPGEGRPATEVRFVSKVDAVTEPAWLATLPALPGGEIAGLGEGVGEVVIEYVPAGDGLVTVRWRYEGDRMEELQELFMSGVLEAAGFTVEDPDAIRLGATAFDVTAGDWTGEIVVGETEFEGEKLTDLVWLLQKN